MFQIDFGDVIGTRSVCVGERAFDVDSTQRTLFAGGNDKTAYYVAQPCLIETIESKDNLDWVGNYVDFASQDAMGETSCELDATQYVEDPLREPGLYNYAEDVSVWKFGRLFAND